MSFFFDYKSDYKRQNFTRDYEKRTIGNACGTKGKLNVRDRLGIIFL